MYKNTWVIVANQAKARLYLAESNESLVEKETFINPEARLKGQDLASDRPGRAYDTPSGDGRSHMGNPKDVKEEYTDAFARHIGGRLLELANHEQIENLYIIASPRFLGFLQKNLDHNLQKLIKDTVDKDLTTFSAGDIRKYLPLVI